jgi:hypothetical protein
MEKVLMCVATSLVARRNLCERHKPLDRGQDFFLFIDIRVRIFKICQDNASYVRRGFSVELYVSKS